MIFHRAILASTKTSGTGVAAASEHIIGFSKLPGASGALRQERYFSLKFQLISHNVPNVSVDIPNFTVKQSSDVRPAQFSRNLIIYIFLDSTKLDDFGRKKVSYSVRDQYSLYLAICALPGLFSSLFLPPLAEESLPPRALTLVFVVFSLAGAVLGRFFVDRFIRFSK